MYIEETILLLYQIFSSGIDDKYQYVSNKRDSETIERFLSRWESRGIRRQSLGVRFLYDYFCDAYNLWTDGGRDLKIIPLSWVLGEPQMGRWDRRIDQFRYSYQEGVLKRTNIPTLSEILRRSSTYSESTSEEYERQRFHNTEEGFTNCLLQTSLYSSTSKWCGRCIFIEQCKGELKEKNPQLALKRRVIKL